MLSRTYEFGAARDQRELCYNIQTIMKYTFEMKLNWFLLFGAISTLGDLAQMSMNLQYDSCEKFVVVAFYQCCVMLNCIKINAACLDVDAFHDDIIKWDHFPRYRPFMRGIHRWKHKCWYAKITTYLKPIHIFRFDDKLVLKVSIAKLKTNLWC